MNGAEYLSFTKKERNGIILLLIILVAVVILPRFLQRSALISPDEEPPPGTTTADYRDEADSTGITGYKRRAGASTATYRKSGASRAFPSGNGQPYQRYSANRDYKRKQVKRVEINSADTTALIALPYIGSKLAARIILFRDKLGGFTSVSQIGEVYGLKDSVFQKIVPFLTCNEQLVRKLNINTAEVEQLKTHPYIRWQFAHSIVNYRKTHGSFRSVDDLLRLHGVDTQMIRQLEPYLIWEQ